MTTKLGTLIELDKGTGFFAARRKLRRAGVRKVKFYLCGLEITHRRLRGAGLLTQITKRVAVRCLLDESGVAGVFPRPYCELGAPGLIVNGHFCDPELLAVWLSVWPELKAELDPRLGRFACGGRQ